MWKVTLRDIRAHFGRFIMTLLAAAIGVAFLCGTLSLRDVMTSTFSSITASAITDDVYVQGEQVSGSGYPVFNTMNADDLRAVQNVEGVKRAYPIRQTEAFVYNEAGEAANIVQAPALGFQYQPELTSGFGVDDSEPIPAPQRDEVLVEKSTATRAGLAVGDTAIIVIDSPRSMTVAGIIEYGTSAAGAAISMYNPEQFEELAGDGIMQIAVTADKAVSQSQLKERIQQVLPETYSVQTAQELEDLTDETIDVILTMVNTFLLVFVAIALAISTFIITNTFAISIKQRQKQFALLRAVGASARQIFAAVLVQAIVIGIIGAGLGVLFGQGLLMVIDAGLDYVDMPLTGAPIVTPATAGISFGIGVLVTVIAALLPSYRASLIPPIEAMREGSGQKEKPLILRTVIAVFMLAGGIAGVFYGAIHAQLAIFGLGVGLLFLAVIGIMPGFAIPVITVLGWIARKIAPATGAIASRSLLAAPRKTATTAAALAIGVALVSAGSSVAASMNATIADDIDVDFAADAIMFPQKSVDNFSEIAQRVEQVNGVESVDSSLSSGFAQIVAIDGQPVGEAAADSASHMAGSASNQSSIPENGRADDGHSFFGAMGSEFAVTAGEVSEHALAQLGMKFEAGNASVLNSGQAVIAQALAQKHGLSVGSTLTLIGSSKPLDVKIGAIAQSLPFAFGQAEIMLPRQLSSNLSPISETRMTLIISYNPDARASAVKADIQSAVKDQYIWSIIDKNDIKDMASGSINSILIMLYALLALSVVIAMMGVVNTLTLSITDRTREIGLLRAVGMHRAGVRTIVLQESIMTTLAGTLAGMALGVGVGLALTRYLEENSGSTMLYIIPWETMGVTLAAAFIVGACASVLPARKAARLNVLEAIAEE